MLAKIGGSVRTVPGAKVVGAVGLGGKLVTGMDDVIRMVGPAEAIMVGVIGVGVAACAVLLGASE
jgi:hypothetical protein